LFIKYGGIVQPESLLVICSIAQEVCLWGKV